MINKEALPLRDYQEKEWWISIEVCDYLRISYSQLKKLILNGTVKTYKLKGNPKGRNYFKSSQIKELAYEY